jgi:hypothetical protein
MTIMFSCFVQINLLKFLKSWGGVGLSHELLISIFSSQHLFQSFRNSGEKRGTTLYKVSYFLYSSDA